MSASTYHLTRLPNGVRIATAEMPAMASVSVGLWAGVGGRHEEASHNGAAHFLEHLLFKGTRRRNAARITREVEGLGGDLNAFTSEDHTCYYAKVEARHLARVTDVLLDMYAHSTLPAAEVERERSVIREEILMGRDTPAQVVEELLAATVWPHHPLGRPLTGTVESVGGMTRDQLLDFWRGHYHGGNTVFTAAGAIRHEDVLAVAKPLLGQIAPGPRARPRPAARPAPQRRVRLALDRRDDEQVQLALGFPGPGRKDPRRFAVRVLNTIAGENMSSRLFQALREKRGLCYSVLSQVDVLQETALFAIYLGLESNKVARSLEWIGRELRRLADAPPSAAELKRAKDYLVGQHRLGLEGTTSQMTWMGECLLGFDELVDPDVARTAVARVTAAEVQACAREVFFGAGTTVIAAVGPVEETADALEARFRRGAGS
ncbi:MAG: insulinase family protein [Verrucomicrobia bacterium]|nr:insulinase family protein [Verrucomicrobiota bacterium]